MFIVTSPFAVFNGLDGSPLDAGYLYLGSVNQNPETNPITAYWDEAMTQPALQPIRTLAGYPVRAGTPTNIYIAGDFSLTVRQKNGVLVYYIPSGVKDPTGTFSTEILHLPSGVGAQETTVYEMFEREPISLFTFMTEVQRNDVQSGIGSIDVYSAMQKAADKALATMRPLTGYGVFRFDTQIDISVPIWGMSGGQFEGQGTVFKWLGSGLRAFVFPAYVQGWEFRNFRIDCQNVTSPAQMMYFSQGCREARFVNIDWRGYYNVGTYADHDAVYVVGGSGATKYDMSQNEFIHCAMTRCRNGIEVTDPSGQGSGNGNKIDGLIALCNGFIAKLPGSSNTFINNEIFVDTGSGGHAYVADGQYAFSWEFIGCDFDGALGTAGWEPVHANTAGSVNICAFHGGINNIRLGNKPNIMLDAGPVGKTIRYTVENVNNEDSTTHYSNALKTAEGITTNNRSAPDGVNIDFAGSVTLTPSGGMTLSAVTVSQTQYELTNKQMTIYFSAVFTVGGVVSSTISFGIPASKVSAMRIRTPISVKSGGTYIGTGLLEIASSGTTVSCFIDGAGANWTAGAGSIDFQVQFPIN